MRGRALLHSAVAYKPDPRGENEIRREHLVEGLETERKGRLAYTRCRAEEGKQNSVRGRNRPSGRLIAKWSCFDRSK